MNNIFDECNIHPVSNVNAMQLFFDHSKISSAAVQWDYFESNLQTVWEISNVQQSNVNANNPHMTYQIISLNSQGNLFICNPDAMLLLIKGIIWESDKWSIWCNIPSPNFPHKILYFLFTSLFILSLDFCQCTYKTSPHLRIPDQRRKNYVYKHKHKHWKPDILLSTRMADSRWHGRARWVLLLWLFQSY